MIKATIQQPDLEAFQRDGYCVVENLFKPEEIEEITTFFEDFKNRGAEVYRDTGEKLFDGASSVEEVDRTQRQVRAMHPHRHSRKVQDWFLNPNIMDTLKTLLEGKDALGVQTMYYFKPPGSKGQGMHQDNFYLVSQPATCIAAWTAIDEATDENGCLWVVPGSHRKDILCPRKNANEIRAWNNYGDSHINPFPRDAKPIPVPVPKGATLFFGGNLIHGSGPNRHKTRSRRTFIGHYIDEASDSVAKFYHPVLDRNGKVVSRVEVYQGGGPCGDGWAGATH